MDTCSFGLTNSFFSSPGGKRGSYSGHSQLRLVFIRPRANLPPITGAGGGSVPIGQAGSLDKGGRAESLSPGEDADMNQVT